MKTFRINGNSYSQKELPDFLEKKLREKDLAGWEKDFFRFLQEWFSPAESVSIFTSGSTGKPKEILLKKTDVIKSARRSLEFFGVQPGGNALLCLPVKYIAGMLMIVRALEGDLNLITVSPQKIDIRHITGQIGFAALVPLQLERLIEEPLQLNKINKMLLGGAQLSSRLSEKLESVFRGTAWETYGMTETITHVAVREIGKDPSRMFRGLPEIRFTSDERSCLVISDELIHPEPIVTNDRVEILSPSIFRLLGRVDNVINSGGVKIQPEELETVLAKYIHGKFCISSIPDTTLGNVVVLVVEKGTDLTVFEQHIEDIPPYQRPRKIIEIPVFPLTSSGKTDMEEVRRFLRQWTIDN